MFLRFFLPQDPMKNLPRSILISMPIVVIVYVLMNVSYLSAMSAQTLFESDAVGVVRSILINEECVFDVAFISIGQKLFSDLGVGSFLYLSSSQLLELFMRLCLRLADR